MLNIFFLIFYEAGLNPFSAVAYCVYYNMMLGVLNAYALPYT